MELVVNEIGDVTVVRITGNLNTETTPEAQSQLQQIIENGAKKLVIDFEKLDYISSSGLRLFAVAAKQLTPVSERRRVCNLSAVVQELFDISGFATLIPVSPSQAAALEEM